MNQILLFLIDHFPNLLDLNLTVSIVILFVICVRQFLKGAPKIFSYALWAIVLLRLLVPISIESPMSFVPERTEFSSMVDVNEVMPRLEFESPGDMVNNRQIRENTPPGEPFVQTSRSLDAQTYLTFGWLAGMAFLLLHSGVSYWKLRKRIRVAVPFRKGIYIADDIDTPFVMGIFRPVIYLPGTLDGSERKYIIAHERHHICRGDHIFKALGFLALTIHWFNPLVWVAFVLASRDMEMSCDEAVLQKLGAEVRAEYSASLLNLATGHRLFAGTPLAFGEGDPTGRVRNLAKWKKPAFWVILICIAVCVVLAVCLLTDPRQEDSLEDMTTVTGPASVGVGDLEFSLPEGFTISMRESEVQPEGELFLYEHVIWKNNTIAGGVYKLKGSDEAPFGTWSWAASTITAENVPEERSILSIEYAENQTDVPYSMEVSYGRNGIVETVHYLFFGDELIYDLWFHMELLSEEEKTLILETAKMTDLEASTTIDDWSVTLVPDRVSRTGATALFSYAGSVPGEEGAELTYGDFLSLERLVDGSWVACDELAGYEYFVGDGSYPVVDGYGMVHEWQNRFGELADGHYRMGKLVKLTRPDGTSEERMIYGEFSIPDSIRTGPIPLEELPEVYGAEQAMIDGCFVQTDGVARENKELFREFAENAWNGIPGFIRLYNCSYSEGFRWSVVDLSFDGNVYTLTSQYYVDGNNTYTFRYLKHFTGEKAWENADHDAFEYYILVNDDSVTLRNLETVPTGADGIPGHWTVYADFTYLPDTPQLPANLAQAVLAFEGEPLVTITDFDRLEKIFLLFSDAELLGYEPKTHSIGVGLNLILTSQDGETMTIELDPDNDLCRIDGEYVFYGAPDEPSYIEKLWYYLDIPAWPDAVYEMCPNAFRP